MSCLKFFYNNLVDTATITASTENLNFPKTNLVDPRRSKVFRSTTNSDNLVFDFGSAKDIDTIFVVDNPRSSFTLTSLSLDLNSTNSWGSPPFTQSVTLSNTFGVGYSIFSQQSYRYARVNLASTAGYCELPKIFIGKSLDIGRGPSFNWNYQDKELSLFKENRYGQKFIDVISRQKVFNLQLNLLDKDMLDKLFEFYDAKGSTKPFYVLIEAEANDIKRFAGMVYMNSIPTISNSSFGRYSASLQLEEAM